MFLYPSWPWFLRIFGLFLVPALGLFAGAVLGWMKREEAAKRMLILALCVSALMVLIAGAAFTYMGEFANSFLDWAFSVLAGAVAYMLLRREMLFLQAATVVCLLYPCCMLLDEAAQTRFKQPLFTLHYTIVVGGLSLAFLVTHAVLRQRWRATKERFVQVRGVAGLGFGARCSGVACEVFAVVAAG